MSKIEKQPDNNLIIEYDNQVIYYENKNGFGIFSLNGIDIEYIVSIINKI